MVEGKPSTKKCHKCHHRFPITHMRKRKVKVNTGHSGHSWSVGTGIGNRRRSYRAYSGRKYCRYRTLWVRGNCDKGGGSSWLGNTFGFFELLIFISLIVSLFQ